MARRTWCSSCMQVLPATEEEKRVAEEKRKALEKEQREAWKAWESFYTPPNDTLLGVLSKWMLIIFGYFGTSFGLTYLYTSPFYGDGGDFTQKFFSVIGVGLLVTASLFYFLIAKPTYAQEQERKKAKKDFSAKHKQFADLLWSEDEES